MASEKSSCALKVLVVSATGQLGRHLVAASARLGHPTVALVRDTAPSDAAKAALLRSFQDAGVKLLKGDLYDHASLCDGIGGARPLRAPPVAPPLLVSAVKAADVVISTVGERQIADQTRLVDAITEAGNVKRFFPAEFGLNVARTGVVDVEPLKSLLSGKAAVRRATEAAGITYTYAVAGSWADLALPTIGIGHGHGHAPAPPTDKAVIAGDGDTRVPFMDERDIATYTVLAAGDPRAENRTLRIRPPANTLSRNELLAMWEKKTGKALEREYIPMDAVLKQAQEAEESAISLHIILAIAHAAYVKGEEEAGFEIDPAAKGVDASELYPDVNYTTVDEYLNGFL